MLDRAVELQAAGRSDDVDTLTLPEVVRVARDAGVDRALVVRAARELDVPAAKAGGGLRGAPSTLVVERVVAGSFPVERFDGLLETLRRNSTGRYQTHVMGRTLFYTATAAGGRVFAATIAVRDGETTVRLESQLQAYANGLHLGLQAGLSWVGFAALAWAGLPAAFIGWLTLSVILWGLARHRIARQVEREKATLQRVASTLVGALESGG